MSFGMMDTPPGFINVLPCTQNDFSEDKKRPKSSNSAATKLRRAFSIPRYPFGAQRSKTGDNKKETGEIIDCDQHQQENVKKNRLFRRSSLRKFITRITQQMTFVNIGDKQNSDGYRVPPIDSIVWPPDQIPAVTGLRNHGNTCFMNAVLQCLSHTDILAEYFVLDSYKADLKKRNKLNARKFGTKGELTEQLAQVLKALWTCKYDPQHSTSFKAVVDRYGTQFCSSTQHDAQEFLFWLLDKVHEDLNTANKKKYKCVKNNYGRPDEVIAAETLANHMRCNNSFVQAVFQAQFRSSLTCPMCHKQSNTFDPFHCISVQLPQTDFQTAYVNVLYLTQHPKQVKLGLSVPYGSPMLAIREQLNTDTGISLDRMILAEINDEGFSRVFCDSHTMAVVEEDSSIYCIETPLAVNNIQNLVLCIINAQKIPGSKDEAKRFGTPYCLQVRRDVSFVELQKTLLKEMASYMKPEIFAYTVPPNEMFRVRLQDPSADPDTYIDSNCEHPLLTEIIDLALSILPAEAGPQHVKLLLEWTEPEKFFRDMKDHFVEHESVRLLEEKESEDSSLTLEECLEHYTKAETLSAEDAWRCPNCQKYLPVVKTLGLWSLPDILVIHFKRFRQQLLKNSHAAKLSTLVQFPINGFDMSPHMARSMANIDEQNFTPDELESITEDCSPWKKSRRMDSETNLLKDHRYDLYAVCYHQGETLETGHYTAACKNPYDHQWYKFDDQRISHIPQERVPEDIVNNEAYILFYQRRTVDNSECSGNSSSSMTNHWITKMGANSVATNSTASVKSVDIENDKISNKEKDICIEVTVIIDNVDKEEELTPNNSAMENCSEIDTTIEEITTEAVITNNSNTIIATADVSRPQDNNFIIELPTKTEQTFTVTKSIPIPSAVVTIAEENNEILRQPSGPSSPLADATDRHSTPEANNGLKQNIIQDTIQSLTHLNNLRFNEIISSHARSLEMSRKTICMPPNLRPKECEAFRIIRCSGNSCSKDTLSYIDQNGHGVLDDEDDDDDDENSGILSRQSSLWISPVASQNLITISPKN